MKILALVENTLTDTCQAELEVQHGISLYIEDENMKILFDVGQDDMFFRNARKLNVDISDIDFLILSHSHYDHGGGLACFLQNNEKARVLLSKACLNEYYSKTPSGEYKYIGLEQTSLSNQRIIFVDDSDKILPNMQLFTNQCNEGFRPIGNKRMFEEIDGKRQPDSFNHELIFVISTPNGDVIFTGCSHSGITNMLETYKQKYPNREIKALIGGFHLGDPYTKKMAEERDTVINLAKELGKFKIELIYTGHCTGDEAFNVLSDQLGNIYRFRTGLEIIL